MTRDSPERRVEALACAQHGVFCRSQAVELGMTPRAMARRVRSGRWKRVHPGVFRPSGVPETWSSDLMAAVLWATPSGLASHRAAGRLWGLDGVTDGPIEIVARMGRCRPDVIVHRLRPDDHPLRRTVDRIPTTDPGRTLLDLAAVLPLPRVGRALDDALRKELVTAADLYSILARDGGAGRRGSAALRQLLGVRLEDDRRLESVLEQRLFRLLRRAGLPVPVPQYEVRIGGSLVARLDFAYPELLLGVETHGYRWHGGYEAWRSDIQRENRLKQLGWIILVFTWADVHSEPERVVTDIRRALGSREVLLPGSSRIQPSRRRKRENLGSRSLT